MDKHTVIKTSRGISCWVTAVSISLYVLVQKQNLIGTDIYRLGPNSDLYILGFCIDSYEKYSLVAVFCFVNSGIRTMNNEILRPWITNQVQDISKPVEISNIDAYEISCVSCIYIWFDFSCMNILLAQIDMMLIEVGADLIMTVILTTFYLNRS